MDIKEAYDSAVCLSLHRDNSKEPYTFAARIAQGDTLRTVTPPTPNCPTDAYSRDIQEVKAESETRAVVFATIKNVTPIPQGAEPDESDKKYRADGFRFKYVLEKTSDGWKIAQVFKYRDYMRSDPWESVYQPRDKPRYPGFVHWQ